LKEQTCFKNHGVRNPGQSLILRKQAAETYEAKTGYDNPSKNPSVKEQKKQTCLKTTGYECNFLNPEIRIKAVEGATSQKAKDKRASTNLKRYGAENVYASDFGKSQIVKTNMKRRGVPNPSQDTDVQDKISKACFTPKKFIFPSGKEVLVQGYEPQALTKLLKTFEEDDIVVGTKNIANEIGNIWYENGGKKHRYFPDIYVKSINKIIEVKST
jgi:hypothetical protein